VSGPPGIGRDPARQLARRELARSLYQPSLWQRFRNAVTGWLNSVLGPAGPRHAGWWTLIVLVIVAVLVIAGLIAWIGPARRSRRRSLAVLGGERLTAADHRRNADQRAAAGDFAGAIVERVRAMATELESRGVLLPRPGRTASELAAEAAGAMPGTAAGLRAAAAAFDDVRYGGRAGTLAGYEQVRDLDLRIAASPAAVGAPGAGP
jgi:type II secretory pathway pseudopilin PulG